MLRWLQALPIDFILFTFSHSTIRINKTILALQTASPLSYILQGAAIIYPNNEINAITEMANDN